MFHCRSNTFKCLLSTCYRVLCLYLYGDFRNGRWHLSKLTTCLCWPENWYTAQVVNLDRFCCTLFAQTIQSDKTNLATQKHALPFGTYWRLKQQLSNKCFIQKEPIKEPKNSKRQIKDLLQPPGNLFIMTGSISDWNRV